ncbi:MAG: ATP-binding protein [Gemmatimonadaceae bacterium]
MEITAPCPLAGALAARLRGARNELTRRWLDRILDRLPVDPNRVFPTEDLLDHVPILMSGIADYIEDPTDAIAADMPVIAKAMELGALRHAQGFDEYELLKEYEIFGGILFAFMTREVDDIDLACERSELLVCAHRLFHAVHLIQQATTIQYMERIRARVAEREDRLRAFNRTLTHELRNRIGAAMGAGHLLELPDLAASEREKLAGVVVRNTKAMQGTLDNLLELTRLTAEPENQRHIRLADAAAEALRQLRDMARGREVNISLSADLPEIDVNAAAVELCLSNLVSNAIKYADPAAPERWVEIRGRMSGDSDGGCSVIIEVADNGLGVPEGKRGRLFERFFRAHEQSASDVEGTGLGLSIVRETVRSLGGRVFAEFPEHGSVFGMVLPCRAADQRTAV